MTPLPPGGKRDHFRPQGYLNKLGRVLHGDAKHYEGGSICNENPFITPSTNELGLYAIYQTKDQSVAVIIVHETLVYRSKFNKLQTLKKHTNIHCIYFPPN